MFGGYRSSIGSWDVHFYDYFIWNSGLVYIYVKEFVVGSSLVGVMAMAGHVSQIN